MNKVLALKIVLSDICCSNGKEFCELCPLNKDDCTNIEYNKGELLEAVRLLSNEAKLRI